jgi:DNA mismatch endonuclease (patch repair protein)
MERIGKKIIFSNKEKENIIDLYQRDYSSLEIGIFYGVSWRFILNKLKEWNIEIRPKYSYTKRRVENIKKVIQKKYEEGKKWGGDSAERKLKLDPKVLNLKHWKEEKSLRDIGKEMGCSEFPIRRILLENGYKIRPFGKITKRRRNKIGILKKGKRVEEIYKPEIAKKMKEQLRQNRANQVFPLKDSKPEIIAREFLDQLNIKYKQHSMINEIKYRYQCDFLIPKQKGINQKIILELDGNYWHANPEYNGNFMNYPQKIRANRIKDFERTAQLEEKGFKVIRLWEHEIKDITLEKFKQILMKSNEQTSAL